MKEQAILRFLNKGNMLATFIPGITLVTFILYAIAAWVSLGHFPIVYRDNPTGILFSVLEIYSGILMLLCGLSLPCWIVSAAMIRPFQNAKIIKVRALVYVLGWVTFVAFWHFDPLHFIGWYFD